MKMNIQQLDLTIPQRHLMEIFADEKYHDNYGNKRIHALLTYMRSLLAESGYASPSLDMLLDGQASPLDFESFYIKTVRHEVARIRDGKDWEEHAVPPQELSLQKYKKALGRFFPRIFLDLFPKPVKTVNPSTNLLAAWEMGYGQKIRWDELTNVKNDDLKAIMLIIYNYIWVCVNRFPSFYQMFLSSWTHYLLTHEWPDNEAFFKEKWLQEEGFRKSCQQTLEYALEENRRLQNALGGRYITVMEAARAVLEKIYGRDSIDKEADAWRKRVTDGKFDLGTPIEGRQGRKFYPVENIISAFQATNQEMITDEDIAHAIDSRSRLKTKLKQ